MQAVERLNSNTNRQSSSQSDSLKVWIVKEGAAWEERRKQGVESERLNSRKLRAGFIM